MSAFGKRSGVSGGRPNFGVAKPMKGGPGASDYEVTVTTDRPADTVVAGQPMTLKVSVTNKSSAPIYQLRAVTKSDSGYYDEKELLFGKIDPGKTATAKAPLGWCETEGHKHAADLNVHFFLDIQINPPYKGDTSAFSYV